MKLKLFTVVASATLLAVLGGCVSNPEETMINIPTTVSLVTSDSIYFVVSQPVDNMDDPDDPVNGVMLPIGKYPLEAEDMNYRYFRSPKSIILASYDFGQRRGGQKVYGGIAVPKSENISGAQLYAYADDKAKNGKILIWKMTKDFSTKHGQKWFLSTEKHDNNTAEDSTDK